MPCAPAIVAPPDIAAVFRLLALREPQFQADVIQVLFGSMSAWFFS